MTVRAATWTIACLACFTLPARAATWDKATIDVNGVEREYFVFVPQSAPASQRPAVIALHGFESDANGLRWLIRSDGIAEEHGFVMIYPNAENKSWNAGKGFGSRNKTSDDLGFMTRLLAELPGRHGLDPERLYVMGFSNGGQLAALSACRLGNEIAAVAIVAQTMNIDDCAPETPVPAALIHGASDPLAPFDGGGPFELRSHADSVDFFRALNETADSKEDLVSLETVRCTSFGLGSAGEVVDCVAFSDGHTWPGGVEFKVDLFGTVNQEIHATEVLFDFFERHRRSLGGAPVEETTEVEEDGDETMIPRRGFTPPPGPLAQDVDIQQHCDSASRSLIP